MLKAIPFNCLKYALGLTVLGYVVWANWSSACSSGIVDALRQPVQVTPLLLAAGAGIVSLLLMSLRWYLLARVQELRLTLIQAVRLGALGYFLGTVLPASAGDLGRAIMMARGESRRAVAVSTVLVDGAVAFWTLLLLVSLAGPLSRFMGDPGLSESGPLAYFVFPALGGVATGLLGFFALDAIQPRQRDWLVARLARFPKLHTTVADLLDALRLYRQRAGGTTLAVLVSLGAQVAGVLSFSLAAQVFLPATPAAPIPSLAQHFVIVPIGMLIQFGFPAPGGLGGCEFGYGVLYSLAMPSADATAVGVLAALVFRGIALSIGILGYVLYLLTSSWDVTPSANDEDASNMASAA